MNPKHFAWNIAASAPDGPGTGWAGHKEMLKMSGVVRGAATRLALHASRSPVTRSVKSSMPKRFMGLGEVKRDPDLERWNNVRDNVDQVCNAYDRKSLLHFIRHHPS